MMHRNTITISGYCRFLKNLDDLSQFFGPDSFSKLHTSAVLFECHRLQEAYFLIYKSEWIRHAS